MTEKELNDWVEKGNALAISFSLEPLQNKPSQSTRTYDRISQLFPGISK